jgi:CheY-like chemotaxis protein
MTFVVTDTGIGIKKEDVTKLFAEYKQLDRFANRRIEGTGLGLSITKNLVDMMGGKISVASEYGKGSTFKVELTQIIDDPTPIGMETVQNLRTFRMRENSSVKNLVRTRMPYGKILVVDDVATNLDVAKGLLAPYGLMVHCASNGRDAIDIVREEKVLYDLILMDHMMPDMDGIETTAIIREGIGTEYARTVPVIALTANALAGNEKMFLSHGFQAFLSKPIDIIKLDKILNEWVRDKKGPATSAEQAEETQEAAQEERRSLGVQIEGVDTEEGLVRFGRAEAFIETLRSYIKHTPELLEKIRAPEREFLHDYAIAVHGIKGSSYGICAHDTGRIAEGLEAAAKKGDFEAVLMGNEALIAAVELLIGNLNAALEKLSPARAGKNEIKHAPDSELLRQLRECASHYDVAGMERVLSELDRFAYETDEDLIDWLKDKTENLEYDEITNRLSDIP